MIGYITLGASDIQKTAAFYQTLFSELNLTRIYDYETFVAWAKKEGDTPIFSITHPFDQQAVSSGNGTMIALQAKNPEQVDHLHALALELGATNEGDPGLRSGAYYCAYFRDFDGNKLNFHCVEAP